MKSWITFKDQVRKSIPNQHFNNNLRTHRKNFFAVKGSIPKTTQKERCELESYPARFYAYHLIAAGVLMLFSVGLVAGYAPEVAQYMGL